MKILGIDPGSGIIGFGCIETGKKTPRLVDAGVIRTTIGNSTASRLSELYDAMNELIKELQPDVAAVEKLFFVQNITTGMEVSQARGVILLALEQNSISFAEYTPLQIKMAITGYGRAKKADVQEMVRMQLSLMQVPKPDDCADALAAALTHATVGRV